MVKLKHSSKGPIFIDSNILIAWFNKEDIDHSKAKKLIQNLPPDVPRLTSNLVIYEVLTVLSLRASRKKALKFGEWFFPLVSYGAIGEVFINEPFEYQTWALFEKIKQKNISFADCASVIIAKEFGAREILTFDRHFKVFREYFDFQIIP